MRSFITLLCITLLLAALPASAQEASSAQAVWTDATHVRITWEAPASADPTICLYLIRVGGTSYYVGCTSETSITLPPGAPPYDAAYVPQAYDTYQVRFYAKSRPLPWAETTIGPPPRAWLPIAAR